MRPLTLLKIYLFHGTLCHAFKDPEIENAIVCDPDLYDQANWTCETYENLMTDNRGENLDVTLKCIGYDNFKDPARATLQKSPTIINYALKVLKIESFNIDTSVSHRQLR